MKILIATIILSGSSILHGQLLEPSKKGDTEKVQRISLPDRILTVKKLTGPPVKAPTASLASQARTPAHLPTHYYFVNAIVCENKRTFLEWHPLAGPDKTIFQAWSDLDWTHAEASANFQSHGRHYITMTFVSHSTTEALRQKGKPGDPEPAFSKSSLPAHPSFQLCGPSALISGNSTSFMQAFHQQLHKPPSPNPSPPETPLVTKSNQKRSTITYWRHR